MAGLPPWAEDIWLKRHPTHLKAGRGYLQKHAGGAGLTRPGHLFFDELLFDLLSSFLVFEHCRS